MKDNDFLKRLNETFRIEADEHIRSMTSGLIELEKTPSTGAQMTILETVYRAVHSLKGAARSVNMGDIESICQSIEGVFAVLKQKSSVPSSEMLDVIHRAVDTIAVIISSQEEVRSAQISNLIKQLDQFKTPHLATSEKPVETDIGVEDRKGAASRDLEAVRKTPAGAGSEKDDYLERDTLQPPERRTAIPQTVRVSTTKLDSLLLQTEEMLSAKQAIARYAMEVRDIEILFNSWKREWKRVQPELRQLQRQKEAVSAAGHLSPVHGKYRVTGREDNFGCVRAFSKLAEFFDWENNRIRLMEERLHTLRKSIILDSRSLDTMVDDLLEGTRKILMLPFSTLLEIFPKMVRDISRDQGKVVELTIRGGEVEIDKRILEEMKAPLIHLVRNCIDHGIKKDEGVSQQGKPSQGRVDITISGSNGNKVEILVSDNGSGIDVAKVKKAAVKHEIISEGKAAELDDKEALQLIFHSGFSTSPKITDLSGRGLGLAIVKEKVEMLGGHISVGSEPQKGTAFRIILPVALSTFRGILVRVADRYFIVPTANVERVTGVKPEEIRTVENRETISMDGTAVSFVRIDDILGLQKKEDTSGYEKNINALICRTSEKRMAFCVDEILREKEVIVRDLGKQLQRVRNISGATILGTGKLVPILNVADMMKSAVKTSSSSARRSGEVEEVKAKRKTILVVEDSFTSRTLLKNILESAGYIVKTAIDGVNGFTTLKREKIDLVVSDIEMPGMDGYALTVKIRSDSRFEDMPVILVTSLDSQEHREKGIDAGANAYIIKGSFDQSNLLEAVRRLI